MFNVTTTEDATVIVTDPQFSLKQAYIIYLHVILYYILKIFFLVLMPLKGVIITVIDYFAHMSHVHGHFLQNIMLKAYKVST